MYTDIVVPDGNEKELIETAKRLGFEGVCFLYPLGYNIPEIQNRGINVFFGTITDEKSAKKARKSSDFVVVESPRDTRQLVEKESPDMIAGIENCSRKDFIHQRNSGTDHIISRLCKKKSVCLGFSFRHMLESYEKEVLLGRVRQNIELMSKYGGCCIISSMAKDPFEMRSPEDLVSLFSTLSMDKKKAKLAMQQVAEVTRSNSKRKKGLLSEGAEVVDGE